MNLNDDQKAAVKRWVAEGCGLPDIQKRLNDEFHLSLTFMDLRFLVLDLNLKIKDRAASAGTVELPKAGAGGKPPEADDAGTEPELGPAGAASGVSVTLDRIVKPGAVISGSVTFSDGVTASWMLDQLGRLALDAGKRKYRPSPQDLQAFQENLRDLLQNRGY